MFKPPQFPRSCHVATWSRKIDVYRRKFILFFIKFVQGFKIYS